MPSIKIERLSVKLKDHLSSLYYEYHHQSQFINEHSSNREEIFLSLEHMGTDALIQFLLIVGNAYLLIYCVVKTI
jgi:hypothetical protein